MRADWDDAPRPIPKRGSDGSPSRVLVITAILAGGLLLTLLNQHRVWSMADHFVWSDNSVDGPQVAAGQKTSQELSSPERKIPERTAEMALWEQVERDRKQRVETERQDPEPEGAGRQTSFNDSNYTAQKRINIIQSVPAEASRRSTGTRQQGLSGSRSATVRWRDARGEITRWQTSFEFQNSRIDNGSFCLNLGKGSIPYRECRKGAQEWLKHQCRTSQSLSDDWRRMYCHAHSSYRT